MEGLVNETNLTAGLAELNRLLDVADLSPEEKGDDEKMWDAENDAIDLAEKLYILHDYRENGNLRVGVQACGSAGFADTPKALYRLLYIVHHQRRSGERRGAFLVDFEDMYKSRSLFALVSPDGQFVADPQFYKYELMIGCRATREHVTGRRSAIECGVPGSDNGVNIASELLAAWWATLLRMLTREWEVYGGNGFRV